jgi:hypothetical protein
MRCLECGEPVRAKRSTRKFCDDACRQAACRRRRGLIVPKAHQRLIREREMARDPRPIMTTLDGCTVERIEAAEAKPIICRYEYLGTMPSAPKMFCGLRTPSGELAGVVVFGHGNGTLSTTLCGPDWRDKVVTLQRGACVHWAHPHAASFLISRACRLAAKEHGWRIFTAYADPAAGEIGVVYQACGWLCLGAGVGRKSKGSRWRFFNERDGRWYTERSLVRRKVAMGVLRRDPNWRAEKETAKVRYVHFEGSHRERKALMAALKYKPQVYPKRRPSDAASCNQS